MATMSGLAVRAEGGSASAVARGGWAPCSPPSASHSEVFEFCYFSVACQLYLTTGRQADEEQSYLTGGIAQGD